MGTLQAERSLRAARDGPALRHDHRGFKLRMNPIHPASLGSATKRGHFLALREKSGRRTASAPREAGGAQRSQCPRSFALRAHETRSSAFGCACSFDLAFALAEGCVLTKRSVPSGA